MTQKTKILTVVAALAAGLVASAHASTDMETVSMFKSSGQSADFFDHSYAYAVFPNICQGGLIIGGAHGNGRVYVGGNRTGDVAMSEVSVGLQAGGMTYSKIIFFETKQALDAFESGTFQFEANASAVAVTAGASASADTGTTGANVGASVNRAEAATAGQYKNGTVAFNVAKGGAMLDASVVGQRFSYR